MNVQTKLICDYEIRSEHRRLIGRGAKIIHLSADQIFGNVFLDAQAVSHDLGYQLDSVSLDLCEVAAYVYLGDKAVSRGRHEKWIRDLSYIVPVRNPDLWNSVKEILTDTLVILSGDNVQFEFVAKRKDSEAAAPTQSIRIRDVPESDSTCLFSGGLDSFAGAVYLLQQGHRPLFASHYAGGSLKNIQRHLLSEITRAFGQDRAHFQYRVTSRSNKKSPQKYVRQESSHRARSFLFMSFAAVAAATHGLSDIFICENGVLSLNVPISDARKGSRSTRHAHPLYLYRFNRLVDALYQRPFRIENPFFFHTKGEEIELLSKTNLKRLIPQTVTCWGYPNQTLRYSYSNHCGYCMPCIVRRVSIMASGLETYDDQYVVDVFGPQARLTQAQRRNVEDMAYFCSNFSSLSKTELLHRYPELVMIHAGAAALAPFDSHGVDRMIQVYRKFAAEFFSVARQRGLLVADGMPHYTGDSLPSRDAVSLPI